MSIIDSEDELDYNLAEVENICKEQEETVTLEDLLREEKSPQEETNDREIKDVIYDINLGNDIITKYILASETNTPVNFILTDKNNKYFSLFDQLRNQENIEDLFIYFRREYNIGVNNFVFSYFIANVEAKKSFVIDRVNIISKISNIYLDNDNFEEEKETFMRKLEILNKKTLEEYKKIKLFYNKLTDLEYISSPSEMAESLNFKNNRISYKLMDGQYGFGLDNGDIIFNNMKASDEFLFIKYQRTGTNFYKIYEDNIDVKTILCYNEKIDKLIEEEKKDNFIFVVMNYKTSTKKEKILLEFDLNEETLTFTYPGDTLTIIKKKLHILLPDIVLYEEKILFISGDFEIKFPNFDNTKMYYLTHFDEIISKFLYVKEESKPRSLLGDKNKYYFKTYAVGNGIIDYSSSFTLELLYGDKYIVNFRSKIINNNSINEFALILSKIFWYYNNKLTEDSLNDLELITAPYTGPDGAGLGAPLEEKKNIEIKVKAKKIDNLQNIAPEIFNDASYSRNCGCPKQPIIIDKEDIPDWEKYNFEGESRDVVTFPPPDSPQRSKRFNFVCPGENNVMSFIPNPDYGSKYPILPCCAGQKKSNLYEKYEQIREDPIKFFTEREEGKIKIADVKTSKILTTNQEGVLADEIEKFIQKAYPNNKFDRLGVLKNSKSSMIHCLLIASEHLNNLKIKNENVLEKVNNLIEIRKRYTNSNIIKRENIVTKLRSNIYKFVNINSAAQENFNLNERQLENRINNVEELFDSKIYYKLLENMFYVNIFVFVYDGDDYYLEKPEHRFFHNREIRLELPTVLLVKHITKKTFPVYELIKTNKPVIGSSFNLLYTDVITKYLKKYNEKYGYLNCKTDQGGGYRINKNFYQNINWNYLLADYEIVGQAINDSGRLYRINIMVDGKELSIYVPPSYPLNVPIREKVLCGEMEEVKELFESPSSKGCRGMWFAMNGQNESVFVPCNDVEKSDKVCVIYELESSKAERDDQMETINILNRNATIIKQLIIWCWNLSNIDSIEDWFDKYVVKCKDSEKFKLFNFMPIDMDYRFPLDISTTEEAIAYMYKYIPLIFRNDHIYLYPQLFDSLKQFLLNYKLLTKGLDTEPNKAIVGIFVNEQDFTQHSFNRIIVGLENWQSWLSFIDTDEGFKNEISDKDCDKVRPYLYKNNNGQIYLVQNSINGSLDIALLISKVWNKMTFNIGYYTTNYNIWNCLDTEKKVMEALDISKEYVMEKANNLSDLKIRTFCDAIIFLTRNDIKYRCETDYNYYLYHTDGTVEQYGDCKDEKQLIWQYDNGNYASLLAL